MVERAREFLIEAGYPNGFHVPLISYTMSGLPEMKDYVEAIAAMWEQIGLETEIREMEFSAWRGEYRGATKHVYAFTRSADMQNRLIRPSTSLIVLSGSCAST